MPPISNIRLQDEQMFRPNNQEIDIFGDLQPPPTFQQEFQQEYHLDTPEEGSWLGLGLKIASVIGMIVILDDNIFDELCRMVLPTRCRYDRLSRLYLKSLIISSGVILNCTL